MNTCWEVFSRPFLHLLVSIYNQGSTHEEHTAHQDSTSTFSHRMCKYGQCWEVFSRPFLHLLDTYVHTYNEGSTHEEHTAHQDSTSTFSHCRPPLHIPYADEHADSLTVHSYVM